MKDRRVKLHLKNEGYLEAITTRTDGLYIWCCTAHGYLSFVEINFVWHTSFLGYVHFIKRVLRTRKIPRVWLFRIFMQVKAQKESDTLEKGKAETSREKKSSAVEYTFTTMIFWKQEIVRFLSRKGWWNYSVKLKPLLLRLQWDNKQTKHQIPFTKSGQNLQE